MLQSTIKHTAAWNQKISLIFGPFSSAAVKHTVYGKSKHSYVCRSLIVDRNEKLREQSIMVREKQAQVCEFSETHKLYSFSHNKSHKNVERYNAALVNLSTQTSKGCLSRPLPWLYTLLRFLACKEPKGFHRRLMSAMRWKKRCFLTNSLE